MTVIDKDIVLHYHQKQFGTPDWLLAVPGRANIIGEHTDYNGGFVMPFCVDKYIWFTIEQSNEITGLNVFSVQYNNEYIDNSDYQPGSWQFFLHNLIAICRHRALPVSAVNICFGGNLPVGAGMSSSSALVCGFIEIFDRINCWNLTAIEKIKLASETEHGAGVMGGLMDQSAIFLGKKDHALLIHCKDLSFEYVKIPNEWNFFLLDTGIKHNLAHTAYNDRRAICDSALEKIKIFGNVECLSDWPLEDLKSLAEVLLPEEFQKMSFVLEENHRVIKMKYAMHRGNIKNAGAILNDSHNGLSTKYDVSIEELDFLAEHALNFADIHGARMMGGGFGGCTINLCHNTLQEDIMATIHAAYFNKFDLHCIHYPLKAESGLLHSSGK